MHELPQLGTDAWTAAARNRCTNCRSWEWMHELPQLGTEAWTAAAWNRCMDCCAAWISKLHKRPLLSLHFSRHGIWRVSILLCFVRFCNFCTEWTLSKLLLSILSIIEQGQYSIYKYGHAGIVTDRQKNKRDRRSFCCYNQCQAETQIVTSHC